MVSRERLEQQLQHLQTITTPGAGEGINRLAFTESDKEGRRYITSLMEEAGLSIRQDAFGNVIGHLAGRDESLPAVMFGSHSDSVPSGGNFDGIVGILAAVEVVRSMKEDGFVPDCPLEVVLFRCEESGRFGTATLGSRAMRGELTTADLMRFKDKDGISLYDALESCGLDPAHIETAKYTRPLKAFFEVHIEQGKVLEHRKIPLGVVTGIAAPTRMRVYIHGNADHSGATPMPLRHDGACAAAEIILAVEKAAAARKEPPVVGTVGIVRVHPCAMNVIPGEVELGIDIRSISAEAKASTVADVKLAVEEICARRDIPVTIEDISNGTPVVMEEPVVKFLDAMCEKAGVPYIEMPSGAGHDTMHWVGYVPAGMLFIPCKDGISHNPAESAELDDIVRVTRALSEAVRTVSAKAFSF